MAVGELDHHPAPRMLVERAREGPEVRDVVEDVVAQDHVGERRERPDLGPRASELLRRDPAPPGRRAELVEHPLRLVHPDDQ